jgi:Flp pilus assembly pilin Flp
MRGKLITIQRRAAAVILGYLSPARLRDAQGQTLTEYALILLFVAIAVVAAVSFLSGTIQTLFTKVTSDF